MIEYQHINILVVSLILSALFSGIEIAFMSANKLHIELQNKQGTLSGKILSKFVKRPARFIGTTLVGNNLALVVYGIFMANLLEPALAQNLPDLLNSQPVIFALQTVIATIIVLVTAEFTPKSIFLLNPDRLLSIFAIPMLDNGQLTKALVHDPPTQRNACHPSPACRLRPDDVKYETSLDGKHFRGRSHNERIRWNHDLRILVGIR